MRIKQSFLLFFLLLWKNILLKIRNPVTTLFGLFVPIAGFAVLLLVRLAIGNREETCFASFAPQNLQLSSTLETALSGQGLFCNFTYFYSPVTTQTAQIIANATAILDNQFTTVEFIGVSSEAELETLANELLTEYNALPTADSPATCRLNLSIAGILRPHIAGVIFDQLDPNIEVTIRVDPTQLNNNLAIPSVTPGARLPNDYRDSGFTTLQDAITQSIIGQRVSNLTTDFTYLPIDIRQMPYPAYLTDSFLTFLELLRIMLVFGFTYCVGIITKDIVFEKETRLRESMLIMGLSKWVNWLSWYVIQLIILTIAALAITLILSVGQIFLYGNFLILFLMLFFYVNSLIAFSFLISTFFNSAKLSLFVAVISHAINIGPYLILYGRINELPFFVKLIVCLFSNSCVAFGESLISRRELEQSGVQWDNIATTKENYDNFPFIYIYMMLILDTIIYLLLTWYFDEVWPKEYGHRRPFYFLFTTDYWCGKSLNCCKMPIVLNAVEDGNHVMENAIENTGTDEQVGIRIVGLGKRFGKKTAVNNLNLNVYSGQITTLLGHNGAGKSTTISMLTGLYPPSWGTAYINDHSITEDTEQIRKSLGNCPQHNILIDGLTVKEQMHFFIRLKGVWNWKKAREEVTTMLKDVKLDDKANNLSHQLSGGMKRRLSVALAFIGGSETVILDEPTSGLDPQARRTIWDLLEKYKEGRTILLTTHFMDEADILSDRIAILTQGNLNAYGSSIFLKSRFGVGYHLIMTKTPACNPNKVFDIVKHYVPDAVIDDLIGSELSFILPSQDPSKFVKLFQFLEESKDVIHIQGYGFALTTMEEVFRRVSDPEFNSREMKKTRRRKVLKSHYEGTATFKEVEEICSTQMGLTCSILREPVCMPSPTKTLSSLQGSISLHTVGESEICIAPQVCLTNPYTETGFIDPLLPPTDVPSVNPSTTPGTQGTPDTPDTPDTPGESSNLNKFKKKISLTSFGKKFSLNNIINVRDRPRLQSVLGDRKITNTTTREYPKFKPKDHEDFEAIQFNTGLTLRFQQTMAILYKRIIYTFRNYSLFVMQLIMPFCCTFFGLLIIAANSIIINSDFILNIQNTLTNPSQASLLFMDVPQTVNTLPNQFNLDLMSNFSLANGFQTATPILQDYQSIVNSVGNYTNTSQCCDYENQILDQFCAHELTESFTALDYCSTINPNFGYSQCTSCLSCQSSCSSTSCPQAPQLLYNPLAPDTFSVSKQGPLEVKTVYINEYILRQSTNDRENFFDSYVMALSTNLEDPLCVTGSCLCCSEFVTTTGTNESNGTCSTALSSSDVCQLPSVGRIHPQVSFSSRVTLWYNSQVAGLIAVGLSILHEYQLTRIWESSNVTEPVPSITITNRPLPDIGTVTFGANDQLDALLSSVCFVFGVAFIASSFMVFLIEEKSNRSKFLQHISGLHSSSYWIGNCIVDLVLAFLVLHLVFLPYTFFPNISFFGNSLIIVYILQASFIFSSIPIAYVASFIFDSALNAFASLLVLHFLIYIVLSIITVIAALVVDNELSVNLQYAFAVVPSYAFGIGVYNVFLNQKRLAACTQAPLTLEACQSFFTVVDDLYTFTNPGVYVNILAPLVFGFICLILTIILVNWTRIKNLFQGCSSSKYEVGNFDNQDVDVSNERERVFSGENITEDAILLRNLTKVFPGNILFGRKAKHAVKNLSIGMNYGECFGLLGVNGAGKTTTFEMLTGNLASTAGTAKIHGFDIKTQLHHVRNRVGYCPQFDALQGYLNSYQLLTLYARIRGVPEGKIKSIVQMEISRMKLDIHANYQVHTYSGGNKRKLSTAAALIGNAPVLLLDEPTTSMDPSTRRNFWEVINEITKGGRCIILTTHSMEECEALCTRLAIMVNGEFKCLGSVQYLKNRFGEGFTLYMRVAEVKDVDEQARLISEVKEFVFSTFPGSMLLSEHGITLDYHLSGENMLYSEIFEILEKKKDQLQITDYGVNQTTLEQIFLKFAKMQISDEVM